LAARCATDRRRHVPRGSIIGVLTNQYHGQCTRHKIRSATGLVEQDKQDYGMWWPCIRRHSRTIWKAMLSQISSWSSPQHVCSGPFPTRFLTSTEARPRPLSPLSSPSSPSAAHEQAGHDAALRSAFGGQSSVLGNTKWQQAKAPEADSILGSDQSVYDLHAAPLLDVAPLIFPASTEESPRQ
jgi:hypothetical protein